MKALIPSLAVTALLGSALIGGVFFAFSSFVMKALARMPSSEGMRAMQSINVTVINRSFLGAFLGTALLSLIVVGLALTHRTEPGAALLLAGAVAYLAGTFLVTVMGNVPLNERLAGVPAGAAGSQALWDHYLERWTRWNHVRTVAATAAALLYLIGLVRLA